MMTYETLLVWESSGSHKTTLSVLVASSLLPNLVAYIQDRRCLGPEQDALNKKVQKKIVEIMY